MLHLSCKPTHLMITQSDGKPSYVSGTQNLPVQAPRFASAHQLREAVLLTVKMVEVEIDLATGTRRQQSDCSGITNTVTVQVQRDERRVVLQGGGKGRRTRITNSVVKQVQRGEDRVGLQRRGQSRRTPITNVVVLQVQKGERRVGLERRGQGNGTRSTNAVVLQVQRGEGRVGPECSGQDYRTRITNAIAEQVERGKGRVVLARWVEIKEEA
jgi:hypothetical protein